jgi:hypothetical protein
MIRSVFHNKMALQNQPLQGMGMNREQEGHPLRKKALVMGIVAVILVVGLLLLFFLRPSTVGQAYFTDSGSVVSIGKAGFSATYINDPNEIEHTFTLGEVLRFDVHANPGVEAATFSFRGHYDTQKLEPVSITMKDGFETWEAPELEDGNIVASGFIVPPAGLVTDQTEIATVEFMVKVGAAFGETNIVLDSFSMLNDLGANVIGADDDLIDTSITIISQGIACGYIVPNQDRGRFVLIADLEDCEDLGLLMQHQTLTLDCQGNSISGTGNGLLTIRGEFTIQDCVIDGFDAGVLTSNAAKFTLRDVTFQNLKGSAIDIKNTQTVILESITTCDANGLCTENGIVDQTINGCVMEEASDKVQCNGDDVDGDTFFDLFDNCPNTANADQADTDGDGPGDVCDDSPCGDHSVLNGGICACDAGWLNKDGDFSNGCEVEDVEVFSCTGDNPADATLCAGDNEDLVANTAKTVVPVCTPHQLCEFVCDNGFVLEGGICIVQEFSCTEVPENAVVCPGDNENLLLDVESTLVAACTDDVLCEYECKPNFILENGVCVEDEVVVACTAVQKLDINGDDAVSTADNTGFSRVTLANEDADCGAIGQDPCSVVIRGRTVHYACDEGQYDFSEGVDCSEVRACPLIDINGDGSISTADNTGFSRVTLANEDADCGAIGQDPCSVVIRGRTVHYACDDGTYSFAEEIECVE